MHVAPTEGTPRDAAGPVIDMLFPPGTPSRVPIAAITGTNGKTTTARMLAHILKMSGYTPGLTTTDGVYIDGQRTVAGDMTGPVSARMVLADPHIDAAVLETARGGLLRAGMGVAEVDVGAVLNVQADHLGLKGIDTLEQLAEVKRIVVEVAKRLRGAERGRPAGAQDGGAHGRRAHLLRDDEPAARAGARAHPRGRARLRARGGRQRPDDHALRPRQPHPALVDAPDPGDARGPRDAQRAERDVRRRRWRSRSGVKLDAIRQGLRTFDTTFFQAPGRMNVFDEHPFKVIFDYGHNAHAVGMLADLAQPARVAGRRIVVLAGPAIGATRTCARSRARSPAASTTTSAGATTTCAAAAADEVPRIMAAALLAAGVPQSAIAVIPDEQEAIDAALRMGRPGDLLLVFADALARSWKQIIYFRPEGTAGQAPAQIAGR